MIAITTLGVCLTPLHVFAQTGQGSISGRVTDPNGALIPVATVTIINDETQVAINTKTDSAGYYNVPSLNPGTYKMIVGHQGFERTVVDGVVVSTATQIVQDVTLSIGRETISVTVTATESLLTSATDVSTTVDHALVETLPYPERSSLGAVLLIPGVNGDPTQAGGLAPENPPYTVGLVAPGASIAVGGAPPGQTSILIDGSDVLQASFPRVGISLSGQNVQEVTGIVGGMSAKYGRTGVGILVQTSRGGTNAYHGGFIWRHTDPGFSSHLLGSNSSALHQNFFSAYLGGPVRIPKLYNGQDKTFFFASFEPARISQVIGVRGTLPTPTELAGNFNDSPSLLNQTILRTQGYAAALAAPRAGNLYYQSPINAQGFPYGAPYSSSSLYKPITGPLADCGAIWRAANPNATSCPNDVGLQLRNNPLAKFIFSAFPTPSNPGPYVLFDHPDGSYETDGTNAWLQRGVRNIDNRYAFRIDQQFNNNNRLFIRYTVVPASGSRFLGVPIDSPITQTGSDFNTSRDIALGYTHGFSDNLVSDFHYSWMRADQRRLPPPSDLSVDYAAKYGLTPSVRGVGFPGIGSFSSNSIAWALQPGVAASGSFIDVDQNYIMGDDISWTHGQHLFQFGVDLRWIQANLYDLSGVYGGKYSFTQSQTSSGSSSADGLSQATFVLGLISSFYNTPEEVPAYYRWRYYAGYFQDNWRILSQLTLNLGLRYNVETPRMEKLDNQAFVSMQNGTYNGVPTNSAFCFSENCGFGKTLWPINWKGGFEPRIGFAYAATPKMTIRASYTLSHLPLTGYEPQPLPDPNFNLPSQTVGGQNGGAISGYQVDYITNPVTAQLTSAFSALNGSRGPFYYSTTIAPTYVDQSRTVPYLQNWNFSIQYQPLARTVVQITYQGVKGTHLVGPYNIPINTAPLSVIIPLIQQHRYLSGSGLPNPYGITNPGSTVVLNETLLQRQYPFQNFFNQNLNWLYPRYGTLHYDGLYLSANQRITGDLSFIASYAWSKSLDDVPDTNSATAGGFGVSPVQNPFDLKGEYSVSGFDQPSRFRAGYTYRLPFGQGKWLHSSYRWANELIGGFNTSGITTWTSGFPNNVSLGSAGYFQSLTPQGTDTCAASTTVKYCASLGLPTGYTLRPNFVPGVPLINPNWKKNPFNSIAGPITPYLNPAAFTVPGSPNNPALGNVPRTLTNARSPRMFTFDAHIGKDFTVHNSYKVGIYVDAQNVLNHPTYYGVSGHSVLSSTSIATSGASAGTFTNNVAANFGYLNPGSSLQRILRYGAQITF